MPAGGGISDPSPIIQTGEGVSNTSPMLPNGDGISVPCPVIPADEETRDHDEARAQTDLPLTADELLGFLANTELLFRLNPHLEIERWEPLPDGFRLTATNELNGQHLETVVRRADRSQAPVFTYAVGLKQDSAFTVEPLAAAAGARLILSERYPRITDPTDPRLAAVDPSLVPWVAALRRHLLARQRWGWLPGWRWWQVRFLPGLPPSQRRIVRLILWVSLGEFAIFLALVLVLAFAP